MFPLDDGNLGEDLGQAWLLLVCYLPYASQKSRSNDTFQLLLRLQECAEGSECRSSIGKAERIREGATSKGLNALLVELFFC